MRFLGRQSESGWEKAIRCPLPILQPCSTSWRLSLPLQEFDRRMLLRTLELAERGRGRTRPNPMVGAMVVREGRVLSEAYHQAAGQDHAEAAALKAAAPGYSAPAFAGRLRGTTVYVSLEPCSHFGRTPPCADLLVEAGVARVVVAAEDPSAKVAGKGLRRLREAGVEVVVDEGEIGYRARRQNDAFRTWAVEGRPFVTYKYAMTLDGCVATGTGHSRWISGEESRREVHRLRSLMDAVVVGVGTLRADDSRLTVRDLPAVTQPLRVVLDPRLSLERGSALVHTAGEGPVLCVCGPSVPERRMREVTGWGVEVQAVAGDARGRPLPQEVLALLGAREVQSLLLEGGPTVSGAWWQAGLIDRIVAFVAPVAVGGTGLAPFAGAGSERMDQTARLRDVTTTRFGQDVMVSGYLREPL